MKERNLVKFRTPIDKEEEASVMVVIEMREDRVLVSDLRFSKWTVPPTDVYPVNDLVVVGELSE